MDLYISKILLTALILLCAGGSDTEAVTEELEPRSVSSMESCLKVTHENRSLFGLKWNSGLKQEALTMLKSGDCDGVISESDDSDNDDDMSICVVVKDCNSFFYDDTRQKRIKEISRKNGRVGCSAQEHDGQFKVACVYEED